jgi:hypothetical protein
MYQVAANTPSVRKSAAARENAGVILRGMFFRRGMKDTVFARQKAPKNLYQYRSIF